VPASSKKGLGRSFESLIPTDLLDESFDPTATQDKQVSELRQIKLSEILADPDQPRRSFDEQSLEELADSIREHGVLQPIVVTPHKGKYQIIAGERRFRASQAVGLDKIPALVRTVSGQQKLELSLIENLQRQDLNIIETATAYQKLRDQFNLTLDEIGGRVGNRSVSTISNVLRLLKLPQSVREALANGQLSEGQARPLIGLDEIVVAEILPKIIAEGWTTRRIEQFKAQMTIAEKTPNKRARQNADSPYLKDVDYLQKRLKTVIDIQSNAKGAGKIVIKFKDSKEYDRIKAILDKDK
jgi:ParB family chromosome partitioning protein